MSAPRFQIFLSSTFRDLREERQAVHEAILELGHFPAGMEAFPAADATPWELIKSVINESDYYILIVGGKYGSTGPDGISYTEMEYNLAVELEKPILAFTHGEPDQIPAGKIELDNEARSRLDSFRKRILIRHCKPWTNKENLKAAVLLSLVHTIRTKPASGWVRNEGLENHELLRRLAALHERYDKQEEELNLLRDAMHDKLDAAKYQDLDSKIEIPTGKGSIIEVQLEDIFFAIADHMLTPCREYKIGRAINSGLNIDSCDSSKDKGDHTKASVAIDRSTLESILRQLLALGLVEPEMVLHTSGDKNRTETNANRYWKLTNSGRKRFLEKSAVLVENPIS
jgi:hypothetical protein